MATNSNSPFVLLSLIIFARVVLLLISIEKIFQNYFGASAYPGLVLGVPILPPYGNY